MMAAHCMVSPYRVAVVPGTSSRRGVSFRSYNTRIDTGTDTAEKSLEAVLLDVGIEASVLGSVKQRAPELSYISVQDRVEPLLQCLQSLQLQPEDLRIMLLQCPRLLSFSKERHVMPVVQFLQEDLKFDQHQVAATLKRFPGIMGYGVKSHLVPHCHYLKSLGIAEEELPQLVLARPQVLGSSIELVITYLRKWLRIERTHVGRLLWSYPLDYSLPRLVLPADTAPADSSMDEANPPPGDSSTDSRSQAVVSSSSGDQQQLPKQVPLWGAAEACSWLPFDIKKIDGGSSGQQDDGSDTGDRPDSSAGGSSKQPPAPA